MTRSGMHPAPKRPRVAESPTPAKVDTINRPPHYTAGGVEVIDAIEAWALGFRLGNVVKYVARADRKGSALEDLRKARWYLDREIQKRSTTDQEEGSHRVSR